MTDARERYKVGDKVQLTRRAYERLLSRYNAQRNATRTGTVAGFSPHCPQLIRVLVDGHKGRPSTWNIAMWEPLILRDNVASGPLQRGAPGRGES